MKRYIFHNGDNNMKIDLYESRDPYTLDDLLQAVDKRLMIEQDQKIFVALSEIRLGYILEAEQYFYNLYNAILFYIQHSTKQCLTDIENIEIAQTELLTEYPNIKKYYIIHYYNKNKIVKNLMNYYNLELDQKEFNMKLLLSKSKMYLLEKKYAVSDEAKRLLEV